MPGFPGGSVVKNPPANAGDGRDTEFDPWVGKIAWKRKWQPTPVFLPGKPLGWRSLVGYSPWGCRPSNFTFTILIGNWDETKELRTGHSEMTER